MRIVQLLSKTDASPSATVLRHTGAGDEDAFLWSLVDLLTLLLIFFIFLYAQSSGRLVSSPASPETSHPAPSAPSATLMASAPEPHGIKAVSIRPRLVSPAVQTGTTAIPAPVLAYSPAPIPWQAPEKNAAPSAAMEDLKQAALSAIQETNDPSCSIRWNQNRLVFVLGERLTFPLGEASLLKTFKPTLERIADLIAAKSDYGVMVSGHTDDTPIATAQFPSNWELSAARAITVAKAIIESGVDPHRISIQGYGEYRPIHPNSTPENKQANRRVEIALFKQQTTDTDTGIPY